jgi:ADP-ribose pyrophosphatase YjhB (NUDIX family)
MALLPAEHNPFGGVVMDPAGLPSDPGVFSRALAESVQVWRDEGVRVVWLQVPLALAPLVPVAVEAGFVYHHATEAWLELTLTLEPGSYIPPFATHYIGAGGVVINEARELLVIQERHHRRRHYKLPGGALHPGEHIADAVIREVKEETGVDTRFLNLVCFRHWHGYRYGKSDIYFVTRLEPLSHDIELDPEEIAECLWMPLDEYLGNPDTHPFNRSIVQSALDLETALGKGGRVLRPGGLPDYGTPETHELFFPGL